MWFPIQPLCNNYLHLKRNTALYTINAMVRIGYRIFMLCKICKKPRRFCLPQQGYPNIVGLSLVNGLAIWLMKTCIYNRFVKTSMSRLSPGHWYPMMLWHFKNTPYLVLDLNTRLFLITKRSISNGLVFRLYSFLNIKLSRFDSCKSDSPEILVNCW